MYKIVYSEVIPYNYTLFVSNSSFWSNFYPTHTSNRNPRTYLNILSIANIKRETNYFNSWIKQTSTQKAKKHIDFITKAILPEISFHIDTISFLINIRTIDPTNT